MPIYVNSCQRCVLFLGRRSCVAYPTPGGIPDAIWFGEHDHHEPYEGDHGVQFEPIDDAKEGDVTDA